MDTLFEIQRRSPSTVELKPDEEHANWNCSSVYGAKGQSYVDADAIKNEERIGSTSLSERSISGLWPASRTFEELFADAEHSGIPKEYAHAGLIHKTYEKNEADKEPVVCHSFELMNENQTKRQLKEIDKECNQMPEGYAFPSYLQQTGLIRSWRQVGEYDDFIHDERYTTELMNGTASFIKFLDGYEAGLEDDKKFRPKDWLLIIVEAKLDPQNKLAELWRIWAECSHLTAINQNIERGKWDNYHFKWSGFCDLLPPHLFKITLDDYNDTIRLRSNGFKPVVKINRNETSSQDQNSSRKRKKRSNGSSASTKRTVAKRLDMKSVSIKLACEERSTVKLRIDETSRSELSIPDKLPAACTFEELFAYAKVRGISEEYVYTGLNLNITLKKVGNDRISHYSFERMTEPQNMKQWRGIVEELNSIPVNDDLRSDLHNMDLEEVWDQVSYYDKFIRKMKGLSELMKGTGCYLKFLGEYEDDVKGNKFRPKDWLLTIAKAQQNSQDKLVELCRIWTECSHLAAINDNIEIIGDVDYQFDWSYLYKLLPAYPTAVINRKTVSNQRNGRAIQHDSPCMSSTPDIQPSLDSVQKIDSQSLPESAVMASPEHLLENTASAGQILKCQPVIAEADSTQSTLFGTAVYKYSDDEGNHYQAYTSNPGQADPDSAPNENTEKCNSESDGSISSDDTIPYESTETSQPVQTMKETQRWSESQDENNLPTADCMDTADSLVFAWAVSENINQYFTSLIPLSASEPLDDVFPKLPLGCRY